DLGLKVILVERYPVIGGVCLNVGCIPSKALLHVAKVIEEAKEAKTVGLSFSEPEIDIDTTRSWKSGVVGQLTKGLHGLAKQRKVTVLQGSGEFMGPNQVKVYHEQETITVGFKQAVIAVGSEPVTIPGFPHDDPRVIDSTGALELEDVPDRLLIVGGGIIGLEMATVYNALGSKVSVVEMLDQIMTGADPDMVRPLLKRLKLQYENIWTSTKVASMEALEDGIKIGLEGKNAPESDTFDRVLVAVGRRPNGNKISAEAAGVQVDERGFIAVDDQMRTNVPHIYAIGDVIGQPMLAHKAVHEGKVAAEVAAGLKSGFDARVIPSVAYTDPEVAWVGLTETEAKAQGIKYEKGAFPWAASGRALSQGRSEGITKLLFDPDSERVIGAAVTGSNAGDLIAEAALAIEMNADAQDIGLTIHALPTLAETIGFAAEAFEGTITDLYMPKKKK
ncbi:MAG: dihydrolipoyl dehydrogenase, partial [Gammaproteobacteria bacterium]